MLSIAGLQIEVPTPDVVEAVLATLDPYSILQFDLFATNNSLNSLPLRYPPPLLPIRIGVLDWPSDAARFATFHVLIDDETASILAPLAFAPSGPQSLAVDMDDGDGGTISTTMYALPIRAISQIFGNQVLTDGTDLAIDENGLNILTLVDQRYFWWNQSENFVVNVGTTAWGDLISSIGSALGLTITSSTISSAYGTPSARFTAYQQPIPLYLDALAYTIGMRICVTLDGDVLMQNTADSITSNEVSLTNANYDNDLQEWNYDQGVANEWALHGGGVFVADDLNQSVPSSVTVWFSETVNGTLNDSGYTIVVSLTSLSLSEFSGVTGYDGSKVIVGDLVAVSTGSTPTNLVALQAYANKCATDWYIWQLGNVDLEFSGIIPWTPSGWIDEIIWFYRTGKSERVADAADLEVSVGSGSMVATRVIRKAWNDRALGDIQSAFGVPLLVEDNTGDSVVNVASIEFIGAVVSGTTPNAIVTITQPPAFDLTVTDNSSGSVANVNNIKFIGATVSGTTPNAVATINFPAQSAAFWVPIAKSSAFTAVYSLTQWNLYECTGTFTVTLPSGVVTGGSNSQIGFINVFPGTITIVEPGIGGFTCTLEALNFVVITPGLTKWDVVASFVLTGGDVQTLGGLQFSTRVVAINGELLGNTAGIPGDILLVDPTNLWAKTTMSGAVTINSSGVTAISMGAVGTTQIAPGAVTGGGGGSIGSGTITSGNIASGTVTGGTGTGNLAAGTVTGGSGGNVATATITGGSGGNLAATTITASNIVNGTITSTQIAANTITGGTGSGNIAAGTVTGGSGGNLAAATVTASNIVNNTITATQIANATITTTQIASATITGSNIAAATVTGSNLVNNTITYGKVQQASSSTLLGNPTGITANVQEITLGTGLAFSGSTLTATGGSGTVTTTGSPASGNLTKFSGASSITNGDLSGDATTSGTLVVTLATVNSNVGTFGDASHTVTITENAKGLTTAAASVSIAIAASQTTSGVFAAARIPTLDLIPTAAADVAIGTNKLTGVKDPTAAQDAATKNYVDLAVAALATKNDCQAATTTALAASTYNNVATPPSGVGATITLTVAAVLVLDGYTPALNDRLLIKNQAAPAQNGLYTLTTLGVLGVTQAVLTRTLDFDQPGDGINGALTFILNGTVNDNTLWSCTTDATVNFGTTAINWFQFQGATYTADGTTLALTGTTFSVNTNGIGNSQIRQGIARSVIGVTGNATANEADIQATADQVLRANSSGTALAFGAVNLAASAAVTGTIQATNFPALTGDITTPGGSLATTLATVNSNVGTFNGITVNGKGLVTAAVANSLSYTPPYGFGLLYVTSSQITVKPGSAVDKTSAVTMSLATSNNVSTVNTLTAVIGGIDVTSIAGTVSVSNASAVITGVSTSFLTAFQRKVIGTYSTSTTTLTAVGTNFLTLNQLAIGDLVGDTTNGFSRVTAIASDTVCTLVIANPGGNIVAGTTLSIIENLIVSVNNATPGNMRINKISTNTAMTAEANYTQNLSTTTLYYSAIYTNSGITANLFYQVWVGQGGTGTCVFLSTQRTTPLGISGYNTYFRRIGVIVFNSGGSIVEFDQKGNSDDREYTFECAQNTNSSRVLAIAGTSLPSTTAFTAVIGSVIAPPSAYSIIATIFNSNLPSVSTLFLRQRGSGNLTATRPKYMVVGGSIFTSNEIEIPVDGAQAFDYLVNASQASGTLDIDVSGFKESLYQ